jgi:hypothetical protein
LNRSWIFHLLAWFLWLLDQHPGDGEFSPPSYHAKATPCRPPPLFDGAQTTQKWNVTTSGQEMHLRFMCSAVQNICFLQRKLGSTTKLGASHQGNVGAMDTPENRIAGLVHVVLSPSLIF